MLPESHIKKYNDDGIVGFTMKVGSVIGGRRRQRGQSPTVCKNTVTFKGRSKQADPTSS